MKVRFFYELDREISRPLVIWGAGKNGKDLTKLIIDKEQEVHWVCDNEGKIGKDIYGLRMKHFSHIKSLIEPQIIIAVSSPQGQTEIHKQLKDWNKVPVKDYWFFS